MTSTPVTIDGAIVSFDPLVLKGDAGPQGPAGPTGPAALAITLSVGVVQTLSAGQSAAVWMTGAYPNFVLNFAIPQGAHS